MFSDQVKGNNSNSEKLTTTLVKNIHLKIKDIHIRYEDNTAHQGSPFSLGFTLLNLSVHTHLGNPVVPQVTEQIHKVRFKHSFYTLLYFYCFCYAKYRGSETMKALTALLAYHQ